MTARAIYKATLCLKEWQLPVKLYSAVQDQTVHFRLLHDEDRVPVKQRLVDPETETVEDYAAAQRAFLTPERDLVLLTNEELETLEPKPSRDSRAGIPSDSSAPATMRARG